MGYLLEILGRGLVGSLRGALRAKLPSVDDAILDVLAAQAQRHPHDHEMILKLGFKYLSLEDHAQAHRCFAQVFELDEESIPAVLGLACVFDETGQTRKALTMLEEARLIDILDPVILFCIGLCSEKLNNASRAIEAYHAALRSCPELRNAHERLAAIYMEQSDYGAALAHYEALVDLDPQRIDDRIALANLCLQVGDPEAAISNYEAAIVLDPENWDLQDDLVSAYSKAGFLVEAIEAMLALVESQPMYAEHHVRLADLYMQIGHDDAAKRSYEQALRLYPDYLEAMIKLGTCLLKLGNYTKAANWFGKAVEANDRLLSACVGMGVAQLQAGRHEEGLSSFELASKIEPNSNLLFSETARMYLKASVGKQAEKYLDATHIHEQSSDHDHSTHQLIERQIARHQDAISQNPNHADLHYRLGLLFKHNGQIDSAISSFQQAVNINPSYEKALIKLGVALREAGQVDRALRTFRKAIDIRPDDVHLHYELGVLFAEKHLFEMAIDHFGIAKDGTIDELQANLALALQNAGLLDRAEASWRTTCNLKKSPPQED